MWSAWPSSGPPPWPPPWSRKLKKGGALAFELGENQADAVKALMTDKGFSDFKISLDFGGVQRAIIGTLL